MADKYQVIAIHEQFPEWNAYQIAARLNFDRLFAQFNARQMRADRAADRIFSWSLIAGLAFAALCIGLALTMGVE